MPLHPLKSSQQQLSRILFSFESRNSFMSIMNIFKVRLVYLKHTLELINQVDSAEANFLRILHHLEISIKFEQERFNNMPRLSGKFSNELFLSWYYRFWHCIPSIIHIFALLASLSQRRKGKSPSGGFIILCSHKIIELVTNFKVGEGFIILRIFR